MDCREFLRWALSIAVTDHTRTAGLNINVARDDSPNHDGTCKMNQVGWVKVFDIETVITVDAESSSLGTHQPKQFKYLNALISGYAVIESLTFYYKDKQARFKERCME